jgi:adenosylhomocysteine nucleosidase
VTGDGADNAERGARALLSRLPVERVIILGAAGALSPGLVPGTVLAASTVIDLGRPAPPPDPAWLGSVLVRTKAVPATLVSGRDILCTPRAKAEAYAALPAGTVAAVDLETAAYARAAAERGIPYVALRAVSDAAEESLPVDFNALRDGSGAVDRRRVALKAAMSPSLVFPLWRLRGRISACAENLAIAVHALLAGGAP